MGREKEWLTGAWWRCCEDVHHEDDRRERAETNQERPGSPEAEANDSIHHQTAANEQEGKSNTEYSDHAEANERACE
jgi:hypothetical protein